MHPQLTPELRKRFGEMFVSVDITVRNAQKRGADAPNIPPSRLPFSTLSSSLTSERRERGNPAYFLLLTRHCEERKRRGNPACLFPSFQGGVIVEMPQALSGMTLT